MKIKADLHIHSCLSPCGSLDMSPKRIVQELKQRDIALAALTDHNTSLNCPAFASLCKAEGIQALFGMEVQSSEEIHILALFNELSASLDFSAFVYALIPNIKNIPKKTGDQVYVDEDENILGELEKYLLNSIPLSVDEVAKEIHKRGGLVVPAHIDRPSFSLTSQFGLVTEGEWDALEIVKIDREPAIDTKGYPLVFSSDAHHPFQIASRLSILEVDEDFLRKNCVDLSELKEAFKTARCESKPAFSKNLL